MNPDFKFRSGKYEGKTYAWVKENNPRYISWVKENQPKMLIERSAPKKEVKVVDVKGGDKEPFKMPLNENFYDDPPEEECIPYMLDHKEQYKEQLEKFKKHNKTRYRLIKEEHENG
jgi:hypothetical protein